MQFYLDCYSLFGSIYECFSVSQAIDEWYQFLCFPFDLILNREHKLAIILCWNVRIVVISELINLEYKLAIIA